ncbi:tetratricopeptide repeat protein 23-like isoform 1 [Mus musculus]|uniref:Tetratricopeptide repeat protein 23-like n=1 Tax=Mus musculus TaxID=10090 RepID=TT23L_MOUSE|nr:tetratricopeptide repeat protein 23-like isoform 1 [Mus musculus]A6H6E9.1 RecName: Full=Tetratricopeptide repeat protein 23-like [Mus musculus]AAI45853.1 Ttc23l protein [Mus musculus]EDL03296.1 mCG18320, isoform CRA_a [Mus musculus]|eukprot:NP_083706.1 tetratricopeptide repeat protein 23-like [Mus musculus]
MARAPAQARGSRGLNCLARSQQTGIPAQETDDLFSTCYCEETEEDTAHQEAGMTVDCLSIPKKKLAQSQKKINQFINSKMSTKANKELIRCFILSQIVFGKEHWKCAQALANLAYGYLTLRGLPAQAKKHAEKARNTLLTWKRNTTSDKDKKEILETLVRLYYTLGVAWLLQNHGKQAYIHLQKAERNMKELKELNNGNICGIQVSEKDLTIALGRASLAMHRMNLALAYFEKAICDVILDKGHNTSELISLYEEIAQIEQLRKNHKQAIQYLQQAYSICVSSFSEVSPQTAEASALLAKAYAMSGASEYRDAVEIYFIRSISTYQTLGSEDYETLTAIEDFCTWLIENGEKQEAYRLLKSTLNSGNFGDCGKKVAETFYNMGSICFAKGELGEAIELLSKCLMIQSLVYGSEHIKSIETKSLLSLLQRWRLKETLEKNRKEASGGETFQKTVITLLQ